VFGAVLGILSACQYLPAYILDAVCSYQAINDIKNPKKKGKKGKGGGKKKK
jgi:hypothetical protein